MKVKSRLIELELLDVRKLKTATEAQPTTVLSGIESVLGFKKKHSAPDPLEGEGCLYSLYFLDTLLDLSCIRNSTIPSLWTLPSRGIRSICSPILS